MPRTRQAGAATIRDVAAASGVSQATAARALGGYGAVSEHARLRVLGAAETLGYRANGVARSMITGRTMTLGLVVGDIENSFFARLARGFTDVVRAAGYDAVVANSDESLEGEVAAVRLFVERRVDGLVVAPATATEAAHLVAAQEAGLDLVLVDRTVRGLAADAVVVDNAAASRHVVAELVSAGHRDVGIVTGGLRRAGKGSERSAGGVSTGLARLAGYRRALSDAGIPFRRDRVLAGDFHAESARRRTAEALASPDRPTALFATDSTLALGVLLGVRDAGLTCPDDVSLVCFDDADWASVVRPALSVMVQPVYDLGAVAARRLVARASGDPMGVRKQVLRATYRSRQSIASPRRTPAGAAGGAR